MIQDTNTKNLCEVWDLTEAEFPLYHGCGRVTVALDDNKTLLACVYHEHQPNEAALLEELAQMQLAHPQAFKAEGMMSCYQFCAD